MRMVSLSMSWRTIRLVDESLQCVLMNLGHALHQDAEVHELLRRPMLVEEVETFPGPK